ncbi:hypothetical protein WOLCODRAFT_155705 [Wolfiporia cocos MD-104 SS10]|uniref:Uncharacterized protein n=1 Tax=Wolfiporia cocos (strain MD-104) TaxID=742152 RepID=A0A2H3JBK4_WOLCO|nr:hypothetical protein WOLCODRAFT_155705 [Wolfiporia cocos MD-104 SS10]
MSLKEKKEKSAEAAAVVARAEREQGKDKDVARPVRAPTRLPAADSHGYAHISACQTFTWTDGWVMVMVMEGHGAPAGRSEIRRRGRRLQVGERGGKCCTVSGQTPLTRTRPADTRAQAPSLSRRAAAACDPCWARALQPRRHPAPTAHRRADHELGMSTGTFVRRRAA